MKTIAVVLCAIALLSSHAAARSIAITGPDRAAMLEGDKYTITWDAGGIESVSLVAHGVRTPLGQKSRGDFHIVIADGVPARTGWVQWTVPWVDSVTFFVKAKGYNSLGQQVAMDERGYGFRPEVLANRTEDGIYLDLHKRTDQRLYVQKNYEITKAYLTTSSENYYWRARGSHVATPHDHAGVFSVLSKERSHYSQLFDVPMPYAMRYHGGHFIHATSPNLYRYLGGTASHGCNRLTREDARELYHSTPLGTRVEVIGPDMDSFGRFHSIVHG